MQSTSRSAVIVLLAACHAPAPTSAPDAAAPPSITGHWISDCVVQPQADGSTLYARIDLTGRDPDRWALDYTLHGDASCTAKLITISIKGPYQVTGLASIPGAWNARFGFDDKTITPYVQPIADALGAGHCGSAPWQLGIAQSVYATGCAAFGQYPQAQCPADYDLVSVSGSMLHFGERPADNDMCSADRRPARLSTVGLTKQ